MKTAYIIRHSKRDEIKDPKNHIAVLLNEEGKLIAHKLGKQLASEFTRIRIFSSPVERCIQTGECIMEEFSEKKDIQKSTILGEPGPFVYGDAWESFSKLGTVGVVKALEENKALPLIRSESEGTKLLLDFVRNETAKYDNNTAVIFITHDACIAPVINFLLDEKFDETHWIEFAGGLEIQFDNGIMTVQRFKGEI